MRYIQVKFLSTKDAATSDVWYYKDELSRALKKYDTVIVPTRYGLSMAVVTGTGVSEAHVSDNLRYATLGSVKSVLEKITSRTVAAEMNKEKAADIKKRLDAEIKKVDAVEKYRVYAELSPAIAEMLKELEELNG